ncbi:DNA mismatch repair protein MutS [Haloplanus aerogenes]|uniref:DNA mismatch repair protein MutS n=1 Tax=Haloplanus aerogenes TaxID=660522 RepID=A0A3M0E927_9EURY|nr:DNA mismatch repair protein MutS [Haloplanus aerogenes]AZH24167.1 DNA mismatch repair protein MutS [Haloplanus aerogenes]RMB24213.1 DNA mismatch repair protein MutS [Haloplanus aerogenes]
MDADSDTGTSVDTDADAVTGPPDGMVDARDELTPMLSQYFGLCTEYEDALLLFQNGDFYQTYCDAAEEVARVCELTLTRREDSTGTYPMAGIPVDNAATYVERLLDAGYRVAVAEQVERPEEASGLVDRAVTQVVTPGTVVDDELLGSGTKNYVAAVTREGTTRAVAAVDAATGACLVTSVDDEAGLLAELDRLAPAELLVGPDATVDRESLSVAPMVTEHEAAEMDAERARETLSAYVSTPDAVVESDAERRACGAVLAYAEWTQGDDGPLEYVTRVRRYDPREALGLDTTAIRSLELFENRGAGSSETLFDILDDTACALGRRKLDGWLRRPLVDRERIEARLDAVEALTEHVLARETVREALREVYDLERLAGRVSRGRANARDLRSLKATLDAVPAVLSGLDDVDAAADRLDALGDRIDPLDEVRDLIDRAIQPDPPVEITEGGVIREGFDDELDRLRETEREGREWVADLEARERERTGIDSLSVGHNQVHGYYIEVTDANLDRVPDDYTRRQTLKNAERFYTPELKRREDEIIGAAERADKLEYELFREVRESVAAETDRVQDLADALAELDALATLAAVAIDRDYARPAFHDGSVDIEAGRHPVVEVTQDRFVPNDATLPPGSVTLVTGPNMSGKSTYMRQVALIVVLAQVGSFVPADAATLPVVDRVFTRVGASDDIAGGQSTFMREMAELTSILHEATPDSLVLLDEVGRGTSTADGRAIARATAEFLHDEVGAATLFATHYHDLTGLADEYDRVRNLHFAAERAGEEPRSSESRPTADVDVTFLHHVAEGPASSSYGVEVARMAGVPDPVVERAGALVDGSDPETNGHEEGVQVTLDGVGADGVDADAEDAAAGDDATEADLAARLRETDIARTTPIEALNLLADLKDRVEE